MPYTGYTSTAQTPPSTSTDRSPTDQPYFNPQQMQQFNAMDPSQQMNFYNSQDILQALYGLLQPGLAANQAGIQDQITAILQQQGFSNQNIDLQRMAAQQGAGFQQAQLGLSGEQLGIEQGANARQAALLPQLHDLVLQGFTQQEQEAWRNTQASQQDLDSQLGARGAFTSIGGNRSRDRIQQSLSDTLSNINRTREQSNLQFNEQVAQNKDAAAQLNIMQKNLGLSGEEINSRLSTTLAQLGLSGQMTTAQLLGELGKVQQGQYSPIQSIIGDIYSISGLQVPAGG